ncbi:MAG: hypothetical protein ACKOU7_09625 [Ferruginibacter sp.]
MKLYGLIITASLFMIAAVSCKSKTAGDLIVNKWHLYEMKGKDAETIPDSVKTKMYNEASIEFTKDGRYQTVGMGTGTQKGSYHFSNDGKQLITTEDGGMADSVSLMELTATRLTVKDAKADFQISFKPH